MQSLLDGDLEKHYRPKFVDFKEIDEAATQIQANNLISTRKALGLSQSAVANFINVSMSQYKKYECGSELMRIHIAQRWSLHFGIPFFQLLKGSAYNPISYGVDNKIPDEWYLANSLSDEYFIRFVNIMRMFSCPDEPRLTVASIRQPISHRIRESALFELDNTMYISIAAGLRNFRRRFSITQELMSEYLGLPLSTYQQYETKNDRPRFSIAIAGRFYLSTGISPLVLLQGTKYIEVRRMQEERIELLWDAINPLTKLEIEQFKPMLSGFFKMAKNIANATSSSCAGGQIRDTPA
jgi:transcriptional regulator with XRE-family HTH domain